VVAVVMLSAASTVMENVPFAVFDAESVTVAVKLAGVVVVGWPVIAPDAERCNPVGSAEPLASAHV
jgi:hypothetical protein